MDRRTLPAFHAFALAFALIAALPLASESLVNREEAPYRFSFEYEVGALKVLSHSYRVGEAGTTFDFVNQGGQEILFPFERYLASLDIGKRNRVSFLYQPLTVETKTVFRELVRVDQTVFLPGDEVTMKYGFPFWRVTWDYLFDLGTVQLGTGLALQLRNASISFAASSGSKFALSQNLGPVGAPHLSIDWVGANGFGLHAEATGIYASSAFLNGSGFSFEGSILDASLRPRIELRNGVEAFLNLRYLGGSAAGTSGYSSSQWSTSVARTTANYLSTMSLTLGATIK